MIIMNLILSAFIIVPEDVAYISVPYSGLVNTIPEIHVAASSCIIAGVEVVLYHE